MLAKAALPKGALDSTSTENLADVLFEIGKDQLKHNSFEEAIYWLDKAYEELSNLGLESVNIDASDLKASTLHLKARALMHLKDESSRTKAWSIVRELDIDQSGRLAVSLLKLNLYATEPEPPPHEYSDVLGRIVKSVHLNETNNKTILHHIHQLKSWAPPLAFNILQNYIFSRLLDAKEYAWLEKALVTAVWIVTTSAEMKEPITSLMQLFVEVDAGSAYSLSQPATQAVQMLLWKSIESCCQQGQFYMAEGWCRLALHAVLERSDLLNVGKLQRKLMLCALSQAEHTKCREVYNEMSSATQNEPISLYILYKLALKTQNLETATECLDSICEASVKDATILYACVLEAQKTGDQAQTLVALQKVLKKHEYSAPEGVHLPALLRCTARLLIKQIEKESSPSSFLLEDICQLFEGAANQAKESRKNPQSTLFTLSELDWYSRNSYNLALKNCTVWDHPYITRMIASCTNFIDLYPSGLDANVVDDLNLRKAFCSFLSGSFLTVMARQEEVIETQLQHYRNVRRAVTAFRSVALSQMDKLGGGAKDDLRRKYASLLAYEFEATANLKSWDEFARIIQVCSAVNQRP